MKMERRNKHSPCRLRQGLIFLPICRNILPYREYFFMDILRLASDILIYSPAIFIGFYVVAKILTAWRRY
jgi:hypothetical protein